MVDTYSKEVHGFDKVHIDHVYGVPDARVISPHRITHIDHVYGVTDARMIYPTSEQAFIFIFIQGTEK